MFRKGATIEAIETVYRSRGADFYRLALARTSDNELARDAVQEGFARAIKARNSFRGSGSLEAWICRCVLNAAHDWCPDDARPEPAGAFAAGADALEAEADIRVAVSRLPERQRDALFLRFYLDLDYAAIAEALGIAVGTVSATLHAARTSLSQALEEVSR